VIEAAGFTGNLPTPLSKWSMLNKGFPPSPGKPFHHLQLECASRQHWGKKQLQLNLIMAAFGHGKPDRLATGLHYTPVSASNSQSLGVI